MLVGLCVYFKQFFFKQISLFNKEMDTLRDSVRKMESKCRLTDDNKDLRTLRKTTDDINRSLEEIKDTTKV